MTDFKLLIIEERPGGCWFIGETEIRGDDLTSGITERTAAALGILPDLRRYRIKRCKICARHFIGQTARRLCSDECTAENIKRHNAKQAQMRAGWRAQWRAHRPPATPRAEQRRRARDRLKCSACQAPLALEASRSSRRFCGDRCRQWAHRHPPASASIVVASVAVAVAGGRRITRRRP